MASGRRSTSTRSATGHGTARDVSMLVRTMKVVPFSSAARASLRITTDPSTRAREAPRTCAAPAANRQLSVEPRGRIDDDEIERTGRGDLHDGAREIGRRRTNHEQTLEIDPRLRDRRSIERRSIRLGDPCAPPARIRRVNGADGGERDRGGAAADHPLRDARSCRRGDLDHTTRQPAIGQDAFELRPVEREDGFGRRERARALEDACLPEARQGGGIQPIERIRATLRRSERSHTEQVTSTWPPCNPHPTKSMGVRPAALCALDTA